MIDNAEDTEQEDGAATSKKIDRKKIIIFILPVLIVIGIAVGIFYALSQDYGETSATYSVIPSPGSSEDGENVTVFYDLPEIHANLRTVGSSQETISLALNVELSRVEDVSLLEAMSARVKDAILSHIIELTPDEVEGANGLYWLKEELLYRLNLVSNPVKIKNLNVKQIEVRETDK